MKLDWNLDAANTLLLIIGAVLIAIAVIAPVPVDIAAILATAGVGMLGTAGTAHRTSRSALARRVIGSIDQWAAQLDTDGDGRVSRAELEAGRENARAVREAVRRWASRSVILLAASLGLAACGGAVVPPDGGLYLEVAAYEVDSGESIAAASYDCALTWLADESRYEWSCDDDIEAGIGVRAVVQTWMLTPFGAAELWADVDGRAVEGSGVALSSDGCAVFGSLRECWRVRR